MKKIAIIFGLILLLLSFNSCSDIKCLFKDCDDPEPDPIPEPQQQVYGKVGCYSASFNEAQGYGPRIYTLGNAYYDQKLNEEIYLQRNFYTGVPANVYLFREHSPQDKNSYAFSTGFIILGYYNLSYISNNFNDLGIAGLLAHEWGHRVQYVHNWSTGNPRMELEADAFSGYYMALAKQMSWNSIQGYFAYVHNTGDFYLNHPQHHGTPNQRLASAYLGVNTAVIAMQNNRPLSYVELHNVFMNEINNQILPNVAKLDVGEYDEKVKSTIENLSKIKIAEIAEGISTGEEVTYPDDLTNEEIEKLYPTE